MRKLCIIWCLGQKITWDSNRHQDWAPLHLSHSRSLELTPPSEYVSQWQMTPVKLQLKLKYTIAVCNKRIIQELLTVDLYPNSTENATFNDNCSLKVIQPLHYKHLQYSTLLLLWPAAMVILWGQATVMATKESSISSSETMPWWTLRYPWDHCPAGRSNRGWTQMYSDGQ